MVKTKDPLENIFARHGISDPSAFLEQTADNESVGFSTYADVQPRGSVLLMLRRVISREQVNALASKLGFA